MCLKTFVFSEPSDYLKGGTGFKIFIKQYHSDIYLPFIYTLDGKMAFWSTDNRYRIGEDYHANINIAKTIDGLSLYPTGFHIFKDYKAVKKYYDTCSLSPGLLSGKHVILEVDYTEVIGSGIDESGFECILVRWMKVVKEVKDDE